MFWERNLKVAKAEIFLEILLREIFWEILKILKYSSKTKNIQQKTTNSEVLQNPSDHRSSVSEISLRKSSPRWRCAGSSDLFLREKAIIRLNCHASSSLSAYVSYSTHFLIYASVTRKTQISGGRAIMRSSFAVYWYTEYETVPSAFISPKLVIRSPFCTCWPWVSQTAILCESRQISLLLIPHEERSSYLLRISSAACSVIMLVHSSARMSAFSCCYLSAVIACRSSHCQ